jgi:carboxyl-terminal processing protease
MAHAVSCLPSIPDCRLPASDNPEVFAAQKTLLEAWQIVGEAFLDPSLNQLDWKVRHREQHATAGSDTDRSVLLRPAWRTLSP